MTRGEFGRWHVTIPAKDGQPAVPHDSKIKVARLRRVQSQLVDQRADIYGHSYLP